MQKVEWLLEEEMINVEMEVMVKDDQRAKSTGRSLDRRILLSQKSVGAAERKGISSVTVLAGRIRTMRQQMLLMRKNNL